MNKMKATKVFHTTRAMLLVALAAIGFNYAHEIVDTLHENQIYQLSDLVDRGQLTLEAFWQITER